MKGERGVVGEEPNHTTARKPGPLQVQIIQGDRKRSGIHDDSVADPDPVPF